MNPIISRYKIPLLIALVVGLVIVIFGGVEKWYEAVFTFLGCIVGMILVDMEFILFAYIVDPQHEKSIKVKEIIKNKSINEYIKFLNEDEYGFGELSVHSLIFIVPLYFVTFYAISGAWYFAKGVTLTMLVCLYYSALIEYLKTKTLERWFWGLNIKLNSTVYGVFLGLLGFSILFLFAFI